MHAIVRNRLSIGIIVVGAVFLAMQVWPVVPPDKLFLKPVKAEAMNVEAVPDAA